MLSETYHLLAHALRIRYPATPIHCRSDRVLVPNSLPLKHSAVFFEYVIINGKRFYTSQTVGWNKSSLVHVVIPGPVPKDAYGEVLEILQIDQDFRNTGRPLWFAQIRWFKPWCGERDQIQYGTNCESPDYRLSTILSSHIPAPMSTSAFGTLENTKTKRQVYLPSSTQTGSEDTS